MGLHVAQMTGVEQMESCFRAVTEIPAAILGLEGYGLEKGCNADLVILQAADPVEALRLKSKQAFCDPSRKNYLELRPQLRQS